VEYTLVLENIHAHIDGYHVLRGVKLEVMRGEYTVILGPSGSGKTTLLRAIAGLQPLSSGRIIIDGEDVTNKPPWERRVALLHQIPGLLPHLTVEENIVLAYTKRAKLPKVEAKKAAKELAHHLEISDQLYKKPLQLSGGQLQRAALAVALAIQPTILLLDEPLSHIDKPLADRLILTLKKIHREYEVTILHVTHDQDEALSLAEKLAVMLHGEIVASGIPTNLYKCPPSIDVAKFLGLNVLPSHLLGLPGNYYVVIPPEDIKVYTERPTTQKPCIEVVLEDYRREKGRTLLVLRTTSKTRDLVRVYVNPSEYHEIVKYEKLYLVPRGDTVKCKLEPA